jgi:hypothetical protein
MRRVHALATAAWGVIAAGACLGFVARDLLGLPRPAIAVAWLAGALLGLVLRPRRHPL